MSGLRFLGCSILAALLSGCASLIGLTENYYEDSGSGPTGPPGGDSASLIIPAGKLVFHRYTGYDKGDSEMYVVAFTDRVAGDELSGPDLGQELGATYGLCNPLNGIFSPDGKRLAVMATAPRQQPCPLTDRNKLEIFVLDLERPGPGAYVQVTQNGQPDEDPQFSPDGSYIVFKHDGHLAKWDLASSSPDAGARSLSPPFTTCPASSPGSFCFNASGGEQSKPVIAAGQSDSGDNTRLCYYESSNENADIYCFKLLDGFAGKDINAIRVPAAVHAGILDSRPLIADQYLYYVRWRDMGNKTRIIARKSLDALLREDARAAFCSEQAADYTDPCALGNDLLIFSSDAAGVGKGDLFLAPFDSPARLQPLGIPGINTPKDELGTSFWRK